MYSGPDGCAAVADRQRQRRLAKGQTEKADSVAPVSADFPITALGVTSEAFQDSLRKYVRTNPDMALDTTVAVNRKVHPLQPTSIICLKLWRRDTLHSKHRDLRKRPATDWTATSLLISMCPFLAGGLEGEY